MQYPSNLLLNDPVSDEPRPYVTFIAHRIDYNIKKAQSHPESIEAMSPQGKFSLAMPNGGLMDGSTNQYTEAPGLGGMLANAVGGKIPFDAGSRIGIVADPKLTQLYKGTQPRQWSGTWQMVPQNAGEAKQIQDILKAVKTWAAPDKGDLISNKVGVLVQPYVFKIEFSNPIIQKMMQLDKMALVSYSINYFSQGYASTYADGMSKQLELTLNFAEFGIKTRSDWSA